MGIPTTLAGTVLEPVVQRIDERWTMAYAASLGETRSEYLDTTRAGGVVAHPLFAVCPEWPAVVASRTLTERAGVSPADVRKSVHATHDVIVHRLIRPGDILSTSLATVGVIDIKPGAMTTVRLRTTDDAGRPVATTTQNGIHLGVHTDGDDRPDPAPPPPIDAAIPGGTPEEFTVTLERGAAHVYTECARIWNPIHTDKAVAQAAGLPDIILHGTANLAHGVSKLVDHRTGGRPDRVRRISCRFAAMVLLPSTITVRLWSADDTGDGQATVPFEVLNEQGEAAVKDGLAVLGDPPIDHG